MPRDCSRHAQLNPLSYTTDDYTGAYLAARCLEESTTLHYINLSGNLLTLEWGSAGRSAIEQALLSFPVARISVERRVAFWMAKHHRLGANSEARHLSYGLLMYIDTFLGISRRVII